MSHSVTVTRTMTTTSSSAIILNTGILRTAPGLLKLFQTIIGAVVLGLVAHYNGAARGFAAEAEQTLLFLVSFAFLITTFLLLASALSSLMAATLISKSIFEFWYHLFGFIFYISASLSFLIYVSNQNRHYKYQGYEAKMAAAVLGLVNSVLYLISTVFSFRFYRLG